MTVILYYTDRSTVVWHIGATGAADGDGYKTLAVTAPADWCFQRRRQRQRPVERRGILELAEVLAQNTAATSGEYVIVTPAGKYAVYCDMTTDGGGLTLVVTDEIPTQTVQSVPPSHRKHGPRGAGCTI